MLTEIEWFLSTSEWLTPLCGPKVKNPKGTAWSMRKGCYGYTFSVTTIEEFSTALRTIHDSVKRDFTPEQRLCWGVMYVRTSTGTLYVDVLIVNDRGYRL